MIWGRREREKNQGKQSFWACNNCRNVVISLWELRKRARGLDMKVISVFWVNSKFPFVLYDQSHPALFSCSVWCHRTDCYLQVCRHCLQLHLFRGFSSHYTDPLDSSLGWVLPSPGLWWRCFSWLLSAVSCCRARTLGTWASAIFGFESSHAFWISYFYILPIIVIYVK